jgi:D-alanine-D-alanine ligase
LNCVQRRAFTTTKTSTKSGLTDEYCPADLPPEITETLQRTAEEVFRVLKLEVYARMDFIVDAKGEVWCLEGNTLPGLTPLSLLPQEAARLRHVLRGFAEAIIVLSMKKYEG